MAICLSWLYPVSHLLAKPAAGVLFIAGASVHNHTAIDGRHHRAILLDKYVRVTWVLRVESEQNREGERSCGVMHQKIQTKVRADVPPELCTTPACGVTTSRCSLPPLDPNQLGRAPKQKVITSRHHDALCIQQQRQTFGTGRKVSSATTLFLQRFSYDSRDYKPKKHDVIIANARKRARERGREREMEYARPS